MFALTRKTDYALIALYHLAVKEDQVCSAREVADEFGIPLPILMNVLKQLTRAGLVTSVRGARGGYALGLAADSITLHDVAEAMEGPLGLVSCLTEHDREVGTCELVGCCPIRAPIRRVHEKMRDFLKSVSIGEIVAGQSGVVAVPCAVDASARWSHDGDVRRRV